MSKLDFLLAAALLSRAFRAPTRGFLLAAVRRLLSTAWLFAGCLWLSMAMFASTRGSLPARLFLMRLSTRFKINGFMTKANENVQKDLCFLGRGLIL